MNAFAHAHRLIGEAAAANDNVAWIDLGGYVDPPSAPAGYALELRRCTHLGTVDAYRFVPRFGDWMQTFTGQKFWPMDPRADEIDINDIAHSLSMQCRYAGHSLRFYSVAEHSVLIARHLIANGSPNAMWGLLHDASEAYLVDVPRPVKPFLAGYREAEAKVMATVAERFGLPKEMPEEVHLADNRILGDERAQNMAPTNDDWRLGEPLGVQLQFWSPEEAEREFLATYWAIIETGRH